jgi:prepilin-type N-terminal cleavage/methylation domain-containing protein
MNAMKKTADHRQAFTLIELLVVISIIAVLASFTIPVMRTVKIRQYETHAQAEMAQIETAIDSYKAAHGFYPPDSPNTLVNQLYYELEGTTFDPAKSLYTTLDGSAQITTNNVPLAFPGVNGFLNCTKPGSGEDSPAGRNFLPGLKPGQYGSFTNGGNNFSITVLATSVSGPDQSGLLVGGVNPWRYNSSSPTNNSGAYDLYVQLHVGGKTYLICNWSKQVQINNPLP